MVTRIGRQAPDGRLVGSDDTGWAAWVDPAGDVPRLVVQDVTAGARAGRAWTLPADAGGAGRSRWTAGRCTTRDREDALAVGAPARRTRCGCSSPGCWTSPTPTEARQLDPAPRRAGAAVLQPGPTSCPARAPQLSPDATYALTRHARHRARRRGRRRAGLRRPLGRPAVDRPDPARRRGGRDARARRRGALRDRPPRRLPTRSRALSPPGPTSCAPATIGERTCFTVVTRSPHTDAAARAGALTGSH